MRLQPQEFETLIDAYWINLKRNYEVQSYFVSLIIAPHVKRNAVSTEKILGPLLPKHLRKSEQQKKDKAYYEQMMKNIEACKAARKRGEKRNGQNR